MPSENGWNPSRLPPDSSQLEWVKVPGAEHVSLRFMKGWASPILKAFAADYHAHVEPLRDADSAAYTPTNTVKTSNHLNATGMDLNWQGPDKQRFRLGISMAEAYPGDKARRLTELLDFYEGMVFCGGYWSIRDWMHFQMGANTWNNPKTADFILRKIRPDGFSTFKRGDTPTPAAADPAWVLAKATGLSLARATEILPAVSAGLVMSQCTTQPRIAMWLAQIGHESAGFKATEEYQSGDESTDRWKYKGRTWIQITWSSNYLGFSKWVYGKGMVPTPTFFVDNPKVLAALQWAGIGPAWYWTVARTTINSLCDRRDLNGVTKLINGGYNGLSDRQTRYNLANMLGDLLLRLVSADTELDEWEALMADTTLYPSLSPYRTDDKPTATLRELHRQNNAMLHAKLIEDAALEGYVPAVAAIAKLAKGEGPGANDLFKVGQAQNIIRTIQTRVAAQNGTT